MVGSWRWAVVALCFVMVCVAAGCDRKAERAPAAKAIPPAGVGLPDWTPKNPSPEFLRAAKVLKPLPKDVQEATPVLPALYELFGTLSDQQITTFLQRKQGKVAPNAPDDTRALYKEEFGATDQGGELVYDRHEVAVPFPKLTPAQREAFDKVGAVWTESFQGSDQNEDMLVRLYKLGAKEDLSNVEVQFSATGHEVFFDLVVKKKGGAASLTTGFAQL